MKSNVPLGGLERQTAEPPREWGGSAVIHETGRQFSEGGGDALLPLIRPVQGW